MKLIRPLKEIEVYKKTDVLVVGGGPAGIGAAVSAARMGAKVILLEKRGFLGGNITSCYVENCNYFLAGTQFHSEGIYKEIEEKSRERYGTDNIRHKNINAFNSEYLKVFLDEFLIDSGVEVILHSFVNEVIMNGNQIEAAIVQTKKGPLALKAQIIIDTTGDADVAYAAGVPCHQGRDEDGLCQPGTVSVRVTGVDPQNLLKNGDRLSEIGRQFHNDYKAGKTGLTCKRQDLPFGRLTRAGQISYLNYACEYFLDPTDSEDLTKGEMNCRKYNLELIDYLKKNYVEFKNIEITSFSPEIGFRDSRRIEGLYTLTIEDCEQMRHFDDVISIFPRFYDMLSPDANMNGDGKVEGKGYKGHIFEPVIDDRAFEIPYRSLIPKNVDNLLVAGRSISADHVAESGVRAVSLCMMTGQAAGTATALAIKADTLAKDVDIKLLQEKLIDQGLTIPEEEING